MKRLKMI